MAPEIKPYFTLKKCVCDSSSKWFVPHKLGTVSYFGARLKFLLFCSYSYVSLNLFTLRKCIYMRLYFQVVCATQIGCSFLVWWQAQVYVTQGVSYSIFRIFRRPTTYSRKWLAHPVYDTKRSSPNPTPNPTMSLANQICPMN